MHRGQLPTCCCRHRQVDGPERPSGRNASSRGNTPSTITSPTGRVGRSRTEISPGARAHHPHTPDRAHAPPHRRDVHPTNNDALALDAGPDTDKQQSRHRQGRSPGRAVSGDGLDDANDDERGQQHQESDAPPAEASILTTRDEPRPNSLEEGFKYQKHPWTVRRSTQNYCRLLGAQPIAALRRKQ